MFVFSGTYSALTGATVDIRRVFRMARLCTAAGLLALAIGSPVFVAGAPAQAAMTGSVDIALKALPEAGAADAGIMRLYGKSHALVISNTEYRNWPRLGNAVKNGRMISEALKEQGFGVTLVANLGHQAMIQTLEEFFTNKGKDSAARLLVVFNGHGHTIGDTGYLVPIDAPGPDDTVRFHTECRIKPHELGQATHQRRSIFALRTCPSLKMLSKCIKQNRK